MFEKRSETAREESGNGSWRERGKRFMERAGKVDWPVDTC